MTSCALIETAQYSLRTSPRSYSHRRKSSCQILTTQLDSVSNLIKISSQLNKIYPWGAGMHSHLTNVAWVRFRFGANCGLVCCWSVSLCAEDFFSGFSGFPSSTKTNDSKFQFDQDKGPARKTNWDRCGSLSKNYKSLFPFMDGRKTDDPVVQFIVKHLPSPPYSIYLPYRHSA